MRAVQCSAGVRRSPAEKQELINLVEHSALPIGRTLAELDVPRSSFSFGLARVQRANPPPSSIASPDQSNLGAI